jgi:hypothetical protein
MGKLLQHEVSLFGRNIGEGVDEVCGREEEIVLRGDEDSSEVVNELGDLREGGSCIAMSSKISRLKKKIGGGEEKAQRDQISSAQIYQAQISLIRTRRIL